MVLPPSRTTELKRVDRFRSGTGHNVLVILRPIIAVRRHASAVGPPGEREARPGALQYNSPMGSWAEIRSLAAKGPGDEQTGLRVDDERATS